MKSILKHTERIRYTFVSIIVKRLTPSLYKKIDLISLIDKPIGFKKSSISNIPRPAIKIMKEKFNGKLVKGAEIGVKKGENSRSILKELDIEKLYLIDIWNNYKGIDNIYADQFKNYKNILKQFRKDKRVRIIKDYSKYATNYIADKSLDFVYIDANHKYNNVYQDIELWFQKVKDGGIIAGHDIMNCHDVLKAVKDFCIKNKILFYIKLPDWYFYKIKPEKN